MILSEALSSKSWIGDSVSTEDGIRMVVEKLDKNRIETVHLYLPENYREHTSDSLETDD